MRNRTTFACRSAFAVVIVAATLAGCESMKETFRFEDLPSTQTTAYQAVFAPKNGSVVFGNVRLVQRDDGVALNVYAASLAPGPFRVAIHATGNCSSPNAFSAGPLWSPPGLQPQVFTITATSDGTATLEVRLRGYKIEGPDGLLGKSVVLHERTGPLDAQPGVPNGRLACGVIGTTRTLF